MASYEQNENRMWSVRFYYAEFGKMKKKRLSGFKTKKEAEQAYSKYITTHVASNVSQYSNMTFFALYDSYIEYAKNRLKVSTLYDIKNIYTNKILPIFANMKFYSITKKDIFLWQQQLDNSKYSYNYKRKQRDYLYNIFQYAIFYYDLPVNPVSQVEPFKRMEAKKEMEIWSEQEFLKFIAEVKNPVYKTFFSFLYLTGCRKGEAFALTWNKIDFDKQTVTINHSLTRKTPGKPYEIVSTKTNNIRTILLPQTLLLMLQELKESQQNYKITNFVFGETYPLAEQTTTRAFESAIKKAGVKKLHLHCLRHSHASYLISQGESIVMVSKRLGHATVEQTLNTYSHLMPNEEAKMISKLELNI